MYKNLENICRICLNHGSRNIFEKSASATDSSHTQQFSIPSFGDNVSSFDRLPEKLRYVTMLKIDECENLPKSICDSCIIQLNVAYNLKKNAIQSDVKLRQYIIEFGMNVTSYTTCSINTVSVIRPAVGNVLPTANTTAATSLTITTAKSTVDSTADRRPFPVMPVIIKEEPMDDYEVMSDITIETNTETFDETMQNDRRSLPNNSQHHAIDIRNIDQQKSTTPLLSNPMVAVNGRSMLLTTSDSQADSQYISAYLPSSISLQSSPESSTSKAPSAENIAKEKDSDTIYKVQTGNTNMVPNTPAKEKQPKVYLENIANESKDKKNNASMNSAGAVKSQKRTRRNLDTMPLSINNGVDDVSQSPRESRIRSGSLPKKDYKTFFGLMDRTKNAADPLCATVQQRLRARLNNKNSVRSRKHNRTILSYMTLHKSNNKTPLSQSKIDKHRLKTEAAIGKKSRNPALTKRNTL